MENKKDPDIMKINSMPRERRIEIAEKVEKRYKEELGGYHISKNDEAKKIVAEIAEEYGITRNEVAVLHAGWKGYNIVNTPK